MSHVRWSHEHTKILVQHKKADSLQSKRMLNQWNCVKDTCANHKPFKSLGGLKRHWGSVHPDEEFILAQPRNKAARLEQANSFAV